MPSSCKGDTAGNVINVSEKKNKVPFFFLLKQRSFEVAFLKNSRKIVKPLMTRTDVYSNVLSAGNCSVIRCAFYILHTSYASTSTEISTRPACRRGLAREVSVDGKANQLSNKNVEFTRAAASNASSII